MSLYRINELNTLKFSTLKNIDKINGNPNLIIFKPNKSLESVKLLFKPTKEENKMKDSTFG